jgi:hypothetical protein
MPHTLPRPTAGGWPPVDVHAEVTTVAAAHVCYELLALMALGGG